jgi:hypothetical protein
MRNQVNKQNQSSICKKVPAHIRQGRLLAASSRRLVTRRRINEASLLKEKP